ncbi:50S ribosomal protein L15 [Persicitalea sp.]|uniref:50S ribosomal protein L15 n=1 Tax=Persicitalea sp. TaxID=3100273 RepID=UPI00359434A2
MNLHNLKPAEGSVRNIKRVGRGQGSGRGGTSTRGHKGAQSRSGYSRKRGFEGGQMPLQRRLPKFGFTSPNRVEYKAINLDTIQEAATRLDAKVLDHEALLTNNMAKKKDLIKVLNRGELSTAVEVHAHKFSKSAVEAIEKAGGKAIVIDRFATETAEM